MDNTKFHGKELGCELKDKRLRADKSRHYIKGQFCLTHQVNVCHCGWEFGWHYETESKELKK